MALGPMPLAPVFLHTAASAILGWIYVDTGAPAPRARLRGSRAVGLGLAGHRGPGGLLDRALLLQGQRPQLIQHVLQHPKPIFVRFQTTGTSYVATLFLWVLVNNAVLACI